MKPSRSSPYIRLDCPYGFGKIPTPLKTLPDVCFECDALESCAKATVKERERKYGKDNPSVQEGSVLIPVPFKPRTKKSQRRKSLWL